MILPPTSEISHHHKVTNITVTELNIWIKGGRIIWLVGIVKLHRLDDSSSQTRITHLNLYNQCNQYSL